MTLLSALLRSWNVSNALDACAAFLRDNPEWEVKTLYTIIKYSFLFNNNRRAVIVGAAGTLIIQAPAVRNSGCVGAVLYR